MSLLLRWGSVDKVVRVRSEAGAEPHKASMTQKGLLGRPLLLLPTPYSPEPG